MKAFNQFERFRGFVLAVSMTTTLISSSSLAVQVDCETVEGASAPPDVALVIDELLHDFSRTEWHPLKQAYCQEKVYFLKRKEPLRHKPSKWSNDQLKLFNRLVREETLWRSKPAPGQRSPSETFALKKHAIELLLAPKRNQTAGQENLFNQLRAASKFDATSETQTKAVKLLKQSIQNLKDPKGNGLIKKELQESAKYKVELDRLEIQAKAARVALSKAQVSKNEKEILNAKELVNQLEAKINQTRSQLHENQEAVTRSMLELDNLEKIDQQLDGFFTLVAQDLKKTKRHQELESLLKILSSISHGNDDCLKIIDTSSLVLIEALNHKIEDINDGTHDRMNELENRRTRAASLAAELNKQKEAITKHNSSASDFASQTTKRESNRAKILKQELAQAKQKVRAIQEDSRLLKEETKSDFEQAGRLSASLDQLGESLIPQYSNEKIATLKTWKERRTAKAEQKVISNDLDTATYNWRLAAQAKTEVERLNKLVDSSKTPEEAHIYKDAIKIQREKTRTLAEANADILKAAQLKNENKSPQYTPQLPSIDFHDLAIHSEGGNSVKEAQTSFREDANKIQEIFARTQSALKEATELSKQARARVTEVRKIEQDVTHRLMAAEEQAKEAEKAQKILKTSFDRITKLKANFDNGARVSNSVTQDSDSKEKTRVQRLHYENIKTKGTFDQLNQEIATVKEKLEATANHAALSKAWLYLSSLEKVEEREILERKALALTKVTEERIQLENEEKKRAASAPALRAPTNSENKPPLHAVTAPALTPQPEIMDTESPGSISQTSSSAVSPSTSPLLTRKALIDPRHIDMKEGDPVTDDIQIRKMDRAYELRINPNPTNDQRLGREHGSPDPNFIDESWPSHYEKVDGILKLKKKN